MRTPISTLHSPTGTLPPPPRRSAEILVVVSIDTEEDNWFPVRHGTSAGNTRALPAMHDHLADRGVRPTYFVAHAVAADAEGAAIVAALPDGAGAEVGAHLHPWNTPPLDEALLPRNTFVGNLPPALQRRKLERLTEVLENVLGKRPRAFRAGRWGIGPGTVAVLRECGYRVDSSVTPCTSWRRIDGPSHVAAPQHAYRIAAGRDPAIPHRNGEIVELPPSFGYSRAPRARWGRAHRALVSRWGRLLLLDRVAARAGLVKHVTLSPETDRVEDMLALTRALLAEGVRHLHLYWHSPSLVPGLTPFVRSRADLARFQANLDHYLDALPRLATIRFATVSEAAAALQPSCDGGAAS